MVIYGRNNTGESIHPCLTPFFDILSILHLFDVIFFPIKLFNETYGIVYYHILKQIYNKMWDDNILEITSLINSLGTKHQI